MATKLFVGNLSFNTTEGDVLDLFKQAGTVNKCELIIDKFTSKSRGFAFVEMGSQDEANKAIAQFNGKELDGRALTVNEAKPREDRPRGGGGGYGGGGGGGGYGGGGGGGGGGRRDDRRSRY
jgi:RNA recognition motif-containing protein